MFVDLGQDPIEDRVLAALVRLFAALPPQSVTAEDGEVGATEPERRASPLTIRGRKCLSRLMLDLEGER